MTSLWAVGGGLTGAYFETQEGTVWDEPYRLVEGRERLPLTYTLQATLREPRS